MDEPAVTSHTRPLRWIVPVNVAISPMSITSAASNETVSAGVYGDHIGSGLTAIRLDTRTMAGAARRAPAPRRKPRRFIVWAASTGGRRALQPPSRAFCSSRGNVGEVTTPCPPRVSVAPPKHRGEPCIWSPDCKHILACAMDATTEDVRLSRLGGNAGYVSAWPAASCEARLYPTPTPPACPFSLWPPAGRSTATPSWSRCAARSASAE